MKIIISFFLGFFLLFNNCFAVESTQNNEHIIINNMHELENILKQYSNLFENFPQEICNPIDLLKKLLLEKLNSYYCLELIKIVLKKNILDFTQEKYFLLLENVLLEKLEYEECQRLIRIIICCQILDFKQKIHINVLKKLLVEKLQSHDCVQLISILFKSNILDFKEEVNIDLLKTVLAEKLNPFDSIKLIKMILNNNILNFEEKYILFLNNVLEKISFDSIEELSQDKEALLDLLFYEWDRDGILDFFEDGDFDSIQKAFEEGDVHQKDLIVNFLMYYLENYELEDQEKENNQKEEKLIQLSIEKNRNKRNMMQLPNIELYDIEKNRLIINAKNIESLLQKKNEKSQHIEKLQNAKGNDYVSEIQQLKSQFSDILETIAEEEKLLQDRMNQFFEFQNVFVAKAIKAIGEQIQEDDSFQKSQQHQNVQQLEEYQKQHGILIKDYMQDDLLGKCKIQCIKKDFLETIENIKQKLEGIDKDLQQEIEDLYRDNKQANKKLCDLIEFIISNYNNQKKNETLFLLSIEKLQYIPQQIISCINFQILDDIQDEEKYLQIKNQIQKYYNKRKTFLQNDIIKKIQDVQIFIDQFNKDFHLNCITQNMNEEQCNEFKIALDENNDDQLVLNFQNNKGLYDLYDMHECLNKKRTNDLRKDETKRLSRLKKIMTIIMDVDSFNNNIISYLYNKIKTTEEKIKSFESEIKKIECGDCFAYKKIKQIIQQILYCMPFNKYQPQEITTHFIDSFLGCQACQHTRSPFSLNLNVCGHILCEDCFQYQQCSLCRGTVDQHTKIEIMQYQNQEIISPQVHIDVIAQSILKQKNVFLQQNQCDIDEYINNYDNVIEKYIQKEQQQRKFDIVFEEKKQQQREVDLFFKKIKDAPRAYMFYHDFATYNIQHKITMLQQLLSQKIQSANQHLHQNFLKSL